MRQQLDGVVGTVCNSNVFSCYNTGNINSTGYTQFIGGVVGECAVTDPLIKFSNSYNVSTSLNYDNQRIVYVGGLTGRVGYTSSADRLTMENNYYVYSNTVENACYRYSSGYSKDGNTSEGELKTYASVLGDAFMSDITPNINNGFPILKWQKQENK